VTLKTANAKCQFSSRFGGKLISGFLLPRIIIIFRADASTESHEALVAKRVKQKESGNKERNLRSEISSSSLSENHEGIRNDLQSIMASLDEVLAGMKKG
jgi:hypothetical protein